MDPLTALSLAGTIVQFVDFGTKLLKSARDLYSSSTGKLEANEVLELITADIVAVCQKLHHDENLGPDFEKVCSEANKVAQELLLRLDRLKVSTKSGSTKPRKWSTLQQALAIAWSKDDVKEMVDRLSKIRDAIETRILFSLRENVRLLSDRTSERFDQLDKQTQNIISALNTQSGPQNTVSNVVQDQLLALAQLISRFEDVNIKEHRKTRAMIIGRSEIDNEGGIFVNPEPLEVRVEDERDIRLKVQKEILESLHFSTMTSRYEEVSETYRETFNWIFYNSTIEQRPWSSFNDWLTSGTGVYWVNGKAGSGKSTLMRHILEDLRTEQLLFRWAQKCPLSIAKFFFWNSGSREQRSQTGLLRGLLFEILSQRPELIPVVFPQYWAKTYTERIRGKSTSFEAWPLPKLMAGFKTLVTQSIEPLKLCLFIDGLDEYDGDHAEMAELFNYVTSSTSVKACISSRPWVVFEEIFQTCPSLRLQELNRGDIEHFTSTTLRGSSTFKRLAQHQPRLANSLIEEIVEYSSGVFLWVRLVVKSLLDGLRNRDSIVDLQRRLRVIPRDLEALYGHMLALTDAIYIEKASEIFQIFRAAMNFREVVNTDNAVIPYKMTVLAIAIAVSDDLDLELIRSMSMGDITLRCEDMQIQLIACCAGLLELGELIQGVSNPLNRNIAYLHRSARDFIERPDTWAQILRQSSQAGFNPNVSLLKSTVCQVHIMRRQESCFEVAPTAAQAMIYAYYAEIETRHSCTWMLDQLEKEMTTLIEPHTRHWSNYAEGDFTYEENTNIFSFAARCGLSLYIAEKCHNGQVVEIKGKMSLLGHLLLSNPYIYNAETVKVLIQYGSNPNWNVNGATIWEQGLVQIYHATSKLRLEHQKRLLDVVEAFVDGGADPKAYAKMSSKRISLLEIITACFQPNFPQQAEALEKKLTGQGATLRVKRRSMMGSWLKKLV